MAFPDIGSKLNTLNDLMPHRIREVLLVSSVYDAFILEEDGYLTERIFSEYKDLNLTSSPRVTHVSSGEEALRAMEKRRFGLVITMTRLADMDVVSFGRRVKALRPGRPVVLLALDESELQDLPLGLDRTALDGVFLWTGNANILLAIIKHIEDRENIDNDIAVAGVRVIIVVEDTVRHYSKFLGLLYTAILGQAQSIMREGLNDTHRIHRLRARPKVLLTQTYDEAVSLYEIYKENVVAVISDIRYPRGGETDPEAGVKLARHIRADSPWLPILLQSAEPENARHAKAFDAHFIHKTSQTLLHDVRTFLIDNLGFGDFIFRRPDGIEVARARDLRTMRQIIAEVDRSSLVYHVGNNHISTWLMARCEFEMARQLRPWGLDDFDGDIERVREYTLSIFDKGRESTRRGVISDFSHESFDESSPFTRLGSGSIGGKARGIAFVNALLHRGRLGKRFPELPIVMPQTLVICTDIFDRFLEDNDLRELAYGDNDDELIMSAFLAARMPETIRQDLRTVLQRMSGPLAVRSSGLLEDSAYEPFAGVYDTYMLPNAHHDLDMRLSQLTKAIRMVYASTFSRKARVYIKRTPHRIEEEKMAVIIQRVVGQKHGKRHYPQCAGVAQSINHYPVSSQSAEDGVVLMAVGLGRQVVQGGGALRFSPRDPDVLPQFSSPRAAMRNTQRDFWAVDLEATRADLRTGEEATLRRYPLKLAEEDGTLELMASVYCAEDDRIREGLHHKGPRLVTFANILRSRAIPLAEALSMLLEVGSQAMAGHVQIEFAVDLGDWGRWHIPEKDRRMPQLNILQLRATSSRRRLNQVDVDFVNEERVIGRTSLCLGTGVFDAIHDVVYVKHDAFTPAKTLQMAQEVGRFNKELFEAERPYLLIGPGRWGSSDHWLGIPVSWTQINGAKVIVEASPPGYHVEPSQGTHFFQNITSLQVGYLTVPPNNEDAHIDWAWLDGQPAVAETDFLRHVHLNEALEVRIDGVTSRALIIRPSEKGDNAALPPRSPDDM